MSLIRAWFYGIGVFIVMTASFVIAMSIAISGPPSDEEMREAAAVADKGMQTLASVTQRFAVEVCQQLPEMCSQTSDGAPRPDRDAPHDEPPSEEAQAEAMVTSIEAPIAPPPEPETPLLGASSEPDANVTAPSHAARSNQAIRASAHLRVARRPGSRRAPPLAPLQARVQGATSLPADAQIDIAAVTPTVAHEINHPAPSEDEAPPQREDPEPVGDLDEDWLDSDQPTDDQGYDDDARYERSGW